VSDIRDNPVTSLGADLSAYRVEDADQRCVEHAFQFARAPAPARMLRGTNSNFDGTSLIRSIFVHFSNKRCGLKRGVSDADRDVFRIPLCGRLDVSRRVSIWTRVRDRLALFLPFPSNVSRNVELIRGRLSASSPTLAIPARRRLAT